MKKEIIYSEKAPKPVGPYSQAVSQEISPLTGTMKLLFLSGQIGIDPDSGELVKGGVEAETQQVFANLHAVLEEAHTGWDKVAKTTIFLTDIRNFPIVNNIYAQWIPQPFPARSTVAVKELPRGAQVEIELIAIL